MKILVISTGEGINSVKKIYEDKGILVDTLDFRKEPLEYREGYDLVICNGLQTTEIADEYRKHTKVFGVGKELGLIEGSRGLGKKFQELYQVPLTKFKSYVSHEELLRDSKGELGPLEYPLYIKHENGRENQSYKARTSYELEVLIDIYKYENGFTIEEEIYGLEFSNNYIINKTGWEYIGTNYDEKDTVGNLKGNAYIYDKRMDYLVEKDIEKFLNMLAQEGYNGVIAITFIKDVEGNHYVIDTNVRFGYTSQTMYMGNIKNIVEVIESIANDTEIPKIQIKRKYGMTKMIRTDIEKNTIPIRMFREGLEVKGNTKLCEGYIIENNAHNGMCKGKEPYLLVVFGQTIEEVTKRMVRESRKIKLLMMNKELPSMGRMMILESNLEKGNKKWEK